RGSTDTVASHGPSSLTHPGMRVSYTVRCPKGLCYSCHVTRIQAPDLAHHRDESGANRSGRSDDPWDSWVESQSTPRSPIGADPSSAGCKVPRVLKNGLSR